MSEEKNKGASRHRDRRAKREQRRNDWRDFNRQQREDRINRIKACHEKKFHDPDFRDRREWFGIFIIIVGLVWLAKAFVVNYPVWLYSWQVLMIGTGLTVGLSSHFRNKAAYLIILVGLAFLARDYIFPDQNLGPYIWPLVVIVVGVIFLLKKRSEDRFRKFAKEHPDEVKDWRHYWQDRVPHSEWDFHNSKKADPDATNSPVKASYKEEQSQTGIKFETETQEAYTREAGDWLNVVTVFSGTRRNIWSKNFKGGEIISVFGGADIDLSRADITGNITIEITVIMGGARLAVPSNWQLKFSETCIMGGTNDSRRNHDGRDPDKTLIITGTILMGGLEIRDIF